MSWRLSIVVVVVRVGPVCNIQINGYVPPSFWFCILSTWDIKYSNKMKSVDVDQFIMQCSARFLSHSATELLCELRKNTMMDEKVDA